MRSTGFGTTLWRACVVGALVCAAVAASPTLVAWHRAGLARGLAEELPAQEAAQAKRTVRRIAALDLAGLPQLLDAAASPREAVAREARVSLSRMLAAWQSRYAGEPLGERLTALIVGVEQRVEQMSDSGRGWAELTALRVVELADQVPARQSAVLVQAGGQVLAATPPSGPRLRNVTSRSASSGPRSTTPALSGFVASLVPPATPALPGGMEAESGGIETDTVARSGGDAPAVERLPKTGGGSLAWGGPTARDNGPAVTSEAPPAEPIETAPPRNEMPKPRTPLPRRPGDRLSVAIPNPGELLLIASRLRRLPSSELIRRMNAADRFEAEQARRILAERGLGERQLERAADLFASDPAVRLRALDALTGWPPGEARSWLRAMLDDPDGRVRLRALRQLAVANDPRVAEFARELERRDPDERVADTASRILQNASR